MIQIDDAGSGSLIGGTCIGVYQTETKNFKYDIIPLEYYSKDNTSKKQYLKYVITIVKNIFEDMNVTHADRIEVCRGYMFDELREWLNKEGFVWKDTIITGDLQYSVEKCFEEYAASLGFPNAFILYTKYPFHFHRILKWVYADYENRSKLVKQGWKSWLKYKDLHTETTYKIQDLSPNLHCYKCGKPIPFGDLAKVLTYESVQMNEIFLHLQCERGFT